MAEVHESVDGTGLEVSGWIATTHEDSEFESFLPSAWAAAIGPAMEVGVPVLFHHNRNSAPIGFVKSLEERPGGLWGSIILPKPTAGTTAFDIYEAVKQKLLTFFSPGGLWARKTIGGRVYLACRRLLEVSLTAVPANVNARTAGVQAVSGVKSIGGVWVADDLGSAWVAAVSAHRLRDLERDLGLAELALDVAALGMHS